MKQMVKTDGRQLVLARNSVCPLLAVLRACVCVRERARVCVRVCA